MSDLFISYSRRDAIFVRRLYDALRVADRTVWVDWEGIPFSAEWKGEIYSAIEAADAFVFVITVHSIDSEISDEDVAHAVKHNKRLVPILLGPVEDQAVPASIRERNWLPFLDERDFGKSFTSLVNTIDADLDWVKSHTRLLTRAIEWNDKKRDSSFDLRGSDLHHAEALISEASTGKDPMLTPLQIEYVVASRRDFAKRQRLLFGLGTLVLLVAVVLGLLWLQKRQEATLIFARNLHEGALSALANYDPLAAEVLSARALTLDGRRENRELLFQARARTPLSAASVATSPGGTGLAFSGDGRLYASVVGNTVEIWDLTSLSRVRTVALLDEAVAAAFSADNTRFAVATTQTIAIWGVAAASDKPELQLATTGNTATLAF